MPKSTSDGKLICQKRPPMARESPFHVATEGRFWQFPGRGLKHFCAIESKVPSDLKNGFWLPLEVDFGIDSRVTGGRICLMRVNLINYEGRRPDAPPSSHAAPLRDAPPPPPSPRAAHPPDASPGEARQRQKGPRDGSPGTPSGYPISTLSVLRRPVKKAREGCASAGSSWG